MEGGGSPPPLRRAERGAPTRRRADARASIRRVELRRLRLERPGRFGGFGGFCSPAYRVTGRPGCVREWSCHFCGGGSRRVGTEASSLGPRRAVGGQGLVGCARPTSSGRMADGPHHEWRPCFGGTRVRISSVPMASTKMASTTSDAGRAGAIGEACPVDREWWAPPQQTPRNQRRMTRPVADRRTQRLTVPTAQDGQRQMSAADAHCGSWFARLLVRVQSEEHFPPVN